MKNKFFKGDVVFVAPENFIGALQESFNLNRDIELEKGDIFEWKEIKFKVWQDTFPLIAEEIG